MAKVTSLVVLIFLLHQASGDDKVKGRGFGDDYDWWSFEAGIKEAQATEKPAMVVIHKSWCGACKRLGPVVAASAAIKKQADQFVMINVLDDEEPKADWSPDGGYIPRIFFYDGKHGEIMADVVCENCNPKYKYFYSSDAQVAASMERAAGKLSKAAATEAEAAAKTAPSEL